MGSSGVVVQELIRGGDGQYSYAALWKKGQPLATLFAKRTRQFPIEFGSTSTFVETVDDPGIQAHAECLLGAAGYDGLVEIEFKHDARAQQFKILDVNPRVWTWIALGSSASVDFPFLAWCSALGVPLTPCVAVSGKVWHHAWRDFIAAAHEILSGRLSGRDYVRILSTSCVGAAFARDDILPALIYLPVLIPRLIERYMPPSSPSVSGNYSVVHSFYNTGYSPERIEPWAGVAEAGGSSSVDPSLWTVPR